MSQSAPVNAKEDSLRDKSHTRGYPCCLRLVLLPSPKNAGVLLLVRIWKCAKGGVREVHFTSRAAAVKPNDRAAWDEADDNLLVSSVLPLHRMFSGVGFVGNRHDDRCGLDSPSNSPVPKLQPPPYHQCLIFRESDFSNRNYPLATLEAITYYEQSGGCP